MLYSFLIIEFAMLLFYRMAGESSRKIYLPLVLSITAYFIIGLLIPFKYAILATLAVTVALYLLFSILFHLNVHILAIGYINSTCLFFAAIILEMQLKTTELLYSFVVALVLLAAADFAGIVFSKDKDWLKTYCEKNRADIYIISFLILAIASLMFVTALGSSVAGRYTGVAALVLIYTAGLFAIKYYCRYRNIVIKESSLEEWLRESRDYMNVIRSQRHDYNLHIHTLVGLINTGNYDEARKYMNRLALEASEINDIMPLNDAVLGSLLFNMREAARAEGSDIYYKITYDMRDTLISGFESIKIIGNLLQNAIDALESEEDKKAGIHMSVFKRRGNTVIQVENRFTGDRNLILKVFEPGFTTKKKHDGIGLTMVLRTVTNAGGRIYPEFSNDMIRFIVNLPNRITLSGDTDND